MQATPTTRVLVLAPDFPPARGGIQTLVARLVECWTKVDCRVLTIASRGGGRLSESTAYRLRRVGSPRVGPRQLRIGLLNLYSLLDGVRFRPQVVLSTHIIVSPAAWAVSRVLRIPYLQYVYGSEVADRPILARFAVRRAAGVIAISEYTAGLLRRTGCNPKRLHRIPPGVDLAIRNGTKRASTPLLITVARLADRYKGHDVVLRALPLVRAQIPNTRWAVVGDGPLRGEYEVMAKNLHLDDAVEFLGALDDAARDAWLDQAHVFVMPARTLAKGAGEGFGIAFLEAGIHHLPVVAGSAGGAPQAVVDGVTGFLVDPTDHVAVANAVIELLRDPRRAASLGRAGAERAHTFAWPLIAGQVEEVLLAAATRRRS